MKPEQHLQHIQDVSRVLRDASMKIKMKKCFFLSKTIDYLGRVIAPRKL